MESPLLRQPAYGYLLQPLRYVSGRVEVEMSIVVVFASALATCSPLYSQVETATILFPAGSNELSAEPSQQMAEVLAPLAGNPLAEVELTAYFPYGDSSSSPAYDLAQSRIDRLTDRTAEAGISRVLIGSSISAVAWSYEGGAYQAVAYAADRLHRVDMTFRIKTECHPLVDLARRLDPYRNQ